MMQNAAETSTDKAADKLDRNWAGNPVRQAILEAARQLVAREGLSEVTLSHVAAEAGFAPPTVYAHFLSRDDLYLAIVADDLCDLAQLMRASSGDAPKPAIKQALDIHGDMRAQIERAIGVASPLPDDGDSESDEDNPDEDEEIPPGFDDDEIEEAPQTGFLARFRRGGQNTAGSPFKSEEKTQVSNAVSNAQPPDDLAAAVAELQQSVARIEARPVDAWLERRLRVFERTLADIEARMEKTERDSATALSTVSEGFKALETRLTETLEEAARHGTESEQRHRAAEADYRAYVKDLSGRLSVVETSLSRLLGDPAAMPPVTAGKFARQAEPEAPAEETETEECEPEELLLVDEAEAEPEAETQSESPSAPQPEAQSETKPESKNESYLNAARRAAKSFQSPTASSPARTSGLHKLVTRLNRLQRSVPRRTLQLIAGILALAVVLIAVNIVLKMHASQANYASLQQTKQARALTPDERIVAMAKAGNPKAQLIAALKFLNGNGVTADIPTAAYWLKRSAAGHEPVAEYWLATLYERGRGVSKDLTQAANWYESAANAGNVKAMYRLGVADAAGWTGEPNYVDAAKWFTRAAQLGLIDAEFNLGVMYERGQGVPENRADAFEWYSIAAAQGDAESKSRIDSLASELPVPVVAKAQAKAVAFQPGKPDPAANIEPAIRSVIASK